MIPEIQEEALETGEVNPINLEPEFFDAPIPGESLTADAENPRPYEKLTQFTSVDEAQHYIFMTLTEDEKYEIVLDTLSEGVPVDMLAQTILFKGFTDGLWTTDLMLLLIEPTVYLLIWIGDEAGIPVTLDSDGDDDDMEDEEMNEAIRKDISNMTAHKEHFSPSLLSKMETFKTQQGEK